MNHLAIFNNQNIGSIDCPSKINCKEGSNSSDDQFNLLAFLSQSKATDTSVCQELNINADRSTISAEQLSEIIIPIVENQNEISSVQETTTIDSDMQHFEQEIQSNKLLGVSSTENSPDDDVLERQEAKISSTHVPILRCADCNFSTISYYLFNRHKATHREDRKFKCSHCDYKAVNPSVLLRHQRTHSGEKPFKCEFCGHKTGRQSSLKEHLRIHTGEKPFSCPECDYTSSVKSMISRHLKSHKNDKPYKCLYCNYRANRPGAIKEHAKIHFDEKPYKCHLCDYKGRKKDYLDCHLRIHNNQNPYPCSFCDYRASSPFVLRNHLAKHTGEKRYKCPHENCKYQTLSHTAMEKHLIKHMNEDQDPNENHISWKCYQCEFKTPVKLEFVDHMKFHSTDDKYDCPFCNEKSFDHSQFLTHLDVHENTSSTNNCNRKIKCFECPYDGCKYLTLNDTQLETHLLKHKNNPNYYNSPKQKMVISCFKCNLCDFQSSLKLEFVEHLKQHSNVDSYNCPFCNMKPITTHSQFVDHLDTHDISVNQSKNNSSLAEMKTRKYKCTFCDFSARHKNDLINHCRTHTGEKPHKCPDCDYRAARRNTLNSHFRRMHSTLRPFHCHLCDYQGPERGDLKAHLRKHMPYQCTQCEYKAIRMRSLRKHLLKCQKIEKKPPVKTQEPPLPPSEVMVPLMEVMASTPCWIVGKDLNAILKISKSLNAKVYTMVDKKIAHSDINT